LNERCNKKVHLKKVLSAILLNVVMKQINAVKQNDAKQNLQ